MRSKPWGFVDEQAGRHTGEILIDLARDYWRGRERLRVTEDTK